MNTSEISTSICGVLSDLGCKFHVEGDDSHYIFVRQPVPMKIRVSDHRQRKREKGQRPLRVKEFRVGKFDMSLSDVVAEITILCKGLPAREVVGNGESHTPSPGRRT